MNLGIVFSKTFNIAVIVVIVTDAVMLGWCASDRNNSAEHIHILMYLIGAFMLVELFLKLYAFGFLFLRSVWNLIDTACILIVCFDLIELLVYVRSGRDLWLRTFSLLRLARIIKGICGISILHDSILGQFTRNLHSGGDLIIYTIFLAFVVAATGALVITSDIIPDIGTIRSSWVHITVLCGDMISSFMTILQVITLDSSLAQIASPLMFTGKWVSFIIVLCIGIAMRLGYNSLLVGSFVEQAQRTSKELSDSADASSETLVSSIRRTVIEKLTRAFGDRAISSEECIDYVDATVDIAEEFQQLDITSDDIRGLWRMLDRSGCELLNIQNLRHGLERLHAPGRGRDLVELLAALSRSHSVCAKICTSSISHMHKRVQRIRHRINEIESNLVA